MTDTERKSDSSNIVYELYYSPTETPKELVEEVKELLKKLQDKDDVVIEIFETIESAQQQLLEDEIRTAATRGKFKVVSGGGGPLAISGSSKKLNLINGPVLVIRRDGRIEEVFPRGIQGIKDSRISPIDFLKKSLFSEKPITERLDDISFTEKNLRNLIITSPSLIEEGLTLLDTEVEIDSAVIDLVLEDRQENHLLLEFKLTAKDQTIGQVTRYNYKEYSRKKNISPAKIRRGIVTLGITGQIIKACKTNNIELYLVKVENLGYQSS
ncbi:MAG: DUF91 domain-containing protein [Candidatus Heimdallarchaeota archaeon]|nr:DUF91 domain-containing protein [Candidatus Heimdallarchaeota archaeon]